MTGIELLSQARAHAPGAKFLLLTASAAGEGAMSTYLLHRCLATI
jgi:hypothetical protein